MGTSKLPGGGGVTCKGLESRPKGVPILLHIVALCYGNRDKYMYVKMLSPAQIIIFLRITHKVTLQTTSTSLKMCRQSDLF